MCNNLTNVSKNFSSAAKTYLANATIQKESALKILEHFKQVYHNGHVLDLGSGVGTFNYQPELKPLTTILFDLSRSMLKESKQSLVINGDANHLPIANNIIDVIISNLMIQWMNDKLITIHEIKRILKVHGYVILTTLIKPSLFELQRAWSDVDNHPHTITFDEVIDYHKLFNQARLTIVKSYTWQKTFYFPNIYTLLQHFKQTGTSMDNTRRSTGLGGRESLQKLTLAYEKQRTPDGLPVSYSYLLLIARKESNE